MYKTLVVLFAFTLSLALSACGHDQVPLSNDDAGRTITVSVGDHIDIMLGTTGPGAYGTPALSSPSIRFVGVQYVGPYTPAGPRQLYQFDATVSGQASISIPHDGGLTPDFGISVSVLP